MCAEKKTVEYRFWADYKKRFFVDLQINRTLPCGVGYFDSTAENEV